MSGVFRSLPSVNELLDSPPLKSLVKRINPTVVIGGVRRFLDDMRTQVQATAASMPAPGELAQRIADWIAKEHPAQRPVINATGILLSRELGGPPLADAAIQAIAAAAGDYASLELDLTTGERCARGAEAERLMARLAGAEAALVVGSHRGALLLSLASLASGREVLLSRGQIVEGDDGARIAELVAVAGAKLCEVGSTNKTRTSDYAEAIGERTAAILCLHADNLSPGSATSQADLTELFALGRRQSRPVIYAAEGAALVDLTAGGLSGHPVVSDAAKAGADLVIFAGDGLVGGPQCGLIVGRRSAIEKLASHPLAKALVADKLTLAALAATLRLYDDPSVRERAIPLFSLLSTPLDNLKNRAERLAPQIAAANVGRVEIEEGEVALRGVKLPSQMLRTYQIAIAPAGGSAASLATALRAGHPAVIGRVEGGRLLMDLRSVVPRQDMQIAAAFEALAKDGAIKQKGEDPVTEAATAGDLPAVD
jgi:L-seryl-tRNA(Ser) seleniumtransferase